MYWIVCFIYLLSAAPHSPVKTSFDANILKEALRSDQLLRVKSMGPEGYKYLRQLSLSEKEPLEHRWQAVLAMAKIGQRESRQDLESHLKSPTWFLRSASLLGLSLIEKEYAQKKAKELMHGDRALLVRTSALQVLSQSPQLDRDFLWKEIYNPINFRNGRGLSLRTSILKVLSQAPLKKEREKFLFLTNDKDPEVRKISMNTLEEVNRLVK